MARSRRTATTLTSREEVYNAYLAHLLNQEKLRATPETTGANLKRPDIRVAATRSGSNQHWRAVECKRHENNRKRNEVQSQAADWLKEIYCEGAVAVLYPPNLPADLDAMAQCQTYEFGVVQADGQIGDWQVGNVQQIAGCIRGSEITGGAKLATMLAQGVEQFAIGIHPAVSDRWREKMNQRDTDEGRANAARIAGLLLINGLMLQAQLVAGKRRLGRRIHSLLGLVEASKKKGSVQRLIYEDWVKIRDVDYRAIIDPLIEILVDYGSHNQSPMFAAIQAADACTPLLTQGQMDYAGPVYHGLLESRYDGSFYTKTSTAILLAELAISDDFVQNWANWNELKTKRICDPACGTGTLLMATQAVLLERFKGGDAAREKLQSALIERMLTGLDINPHAIHLAACMLTLSSGNIAYSDTGLHMVEHGTMERGNTRCGSLELLTGNVKYLSEDLGLNPVASQATAQGEVEVDPTKVVPPDSIDLVIMNPPFTRNAIRNDQFAAREQERIQKREREVARAANDKLHRDAINNTTIGTYFVPIADLVGKAESGTLAMVKPTTSCTNPSGRNERKLLLDRYNVEAVITSHDNANIAFSGNTSIHESLIVARRKVQDLATPHVVQFVSLTKNPHGALEAKQTAQAIRAAVAGNLAALAEIGTICGVEQAELAKRETWSHVVFVNQLLVGEYEKYIVGNADLEPLGRQMISMVAPRGVRGAFDKDFNVNVAAKDLHAAWTNSSSDRTTMAATGDTKITPKLGKKKQAKDLYAKRAHLLLPEHLEPSNCRMVAGYASKPTLGSAFAPTKLVSRALEKAATVWLNSTPGILQMLVHRSRKLTYPQFSQVQLRRWLIPINNIGELAQAYEQLKHEELRPIPELATDTVRLALDDAVAQAIPSLARPLPKWREWIAEEPTVHDRKPNGIPSEVHSDESAGDS